MDTSQQRFEPETLDGTGPRSSLDHIQGMHPFTLRQQEQNESAGRCTPSHSWLAPISTPVGPCTRASGFRAGVPTPHIALHLLGTRMKVLDKGVLRELLRALY